MIQTLSTHRGSIPHPVAVSRFFPRSAAALLTAALLAQTILGTTEVSAETWTSLRGTHSVDAKMVGLWGDSVVLLLNSGRRVSVKLDDLRSESRIQAQKLAKELDSARGQRVQELKGQASAAAAPAPNPIPTPPAAPAYVPPKPNQSSTNFFAEFDQAIASGHILAIYDSLPPSYRQDINDIVQLTAQRTDPAAWQMLVGTVGQIGATLETRQNWFLSSPRVQALPAEQIQMAQGPLVTLAGLMRVACDPQAMHPQTLQTMDFREWLIQRDQAIAPYLAQLFQQLGRDSLRQVTVESESNGVAVASIDVEGSKRKVTYVWVDGYWVPKSLAETWATSVQNWKQAPESNLGTAMAAASLVLQPIAVGLNSMQSASDAGSFHEAMETVFTPAQTVIMSVAAMMGRNINLAGRSNNQNGYGGYGDEFGDDFDGEMMNGYEAEMMGMDDEDAQYRGQNFGQNYGQQQGGRGP